MLTSPHWRLHLLLSAERFITPKKKEKEKKRKVEGMGEMPFTSTLCKGEGDC